jgi:MFS family permease
MSAPPSAGRGTAHGSTIGSRERLVLGVLCFVYVLNFLDRQLLSILAKPIQDSLHVSDGQLGLIGGLYFALFYCLISIPIGWIADRTSRVGILALACAVWSAATAACGLATSYLQLVAARMTVGVGEAGGVPPSYAIISDSFPPGRRGTALAIYNLGPPIGAALGVAFGGTIAAVFDWRTAFVALGLVGILAALLVVLIVREPERGARDRPAIAVNPAPGFFETIAMFFSRRVLVLAALAGGVTEIIIYGAGNFSTLFLMREKAMTLQQIAFYYAIVLGLGAGGGIYLSGRALDVFTRRSRSAYAIIPATALVLAVPFYLGFVWAPAWQASLAFLVGPTFFNGFFLSPVVALVQEEVVPQQRVLSGALLLLVMNMMGMGIGPTFVGAVSDYFHAQYPQHSLQIAFYGLMPCYGVAIALFAALWRALNAETRPAGEPRL